jgi:hypothetical protein
MSATYDSWDARQAIACPTVHLTEGRMPRPTRPYPPQRYSDRVDELLHSWKDYNVAMTGAIAALAGLVIVAASVNIERIVKAPMLTSR